jgi:sugar lactone lactonase YvrE
MPGREAWFFLPPIKVKGEVSMHLLHPRCVLVGAALFAITGCGTTGAGSTPSSPGLSALPGGFAHTGMPFALFTGARSHAPHRAVRPNYAAKASLVFEADQSEESINVYQTSDLSENPDPIVTFKVQAGCPYGMALDKKGTLFVADNCGGNDVEEYAKGSTTEKVAITDGVSNPLGVAIDKHGTLYVSNYPAAIEEYKKGATSPYQSVTGQGLTDPFGLALDKDQNLYIADFGASAVFEVKYGTTTATNLDLADCGEPVGVAVNQSNGDLWVACGSGNTINVYQSGQSTPFQEIPGSAYPYAISLQNKGKPLDTVVVSDIETKAIYAFAPGKYTSYATLTEGIELPTGVLIAKP